MAGELRNQLSWSFSRHGSFQTCLRGYYYHYYGAWGGWAADADPGVRRLYVLKNLKSRHLWAGAIVHEAIARLLERARHRQPLPRAEADRDAFAEEAVARMRVEFRQSRSAAYLKDPRRVCGLLEHHYGEPVAAEDWRALADQVRCSIRNFLDGPHLALAGEVAREDWLALEDLESFPLGGVPVFVKMDLAWRPPAGGLLIIDWKTGRREPQSDGLQLAVYALHACERWGADPASIEIREVNVSSGAQSAAHFSAGQLEGARAAITASIAAMRARLADADANLARLEDFPAQPAPRTCRWCCFREACPACAGPAPGQGGGA